MRYDYSISYIYVRKHTQLHCQSYVQLTGCTNGVSACLCVMHVLLMRSLFYSVKSSSGAGYPKQPAYPTQQPAYPTQQPAYPTQGYPPQYGGPPPPYVQQPQPTTRMFT